MIHVCLGNTVMPAWSMLVSGQEHNQLWCGSKMNYMVFRSFVRFPFTFNNFMNWVFIPYFIPTVVDTTLDLS